MKGKISFEESIIEGKIKDLIDMKLMRENSSQEILF